MQINNKFLLSHYLELFNEEPFGVFVVQEGEKIFNFSWFSFQEDFVKVFVNENQLQYPKDYSVSLNNKNIGGKVILTEQPVVGSILIVRRQSEIKRVSEYTQNGEFRSKTINGDFDYLVSVLEEIAFKLTRCVSISAYDYVSQQENLTIPNNNDLKGKLLGVNNNGFFVGVDPSQGGGGGSSFDNNWVKVSNDITIITQIKLYAEAQNELTIILPKVGATDIGKEIQIINPEEISKNRVIIKTFDTATTIGITNNNQIFLTVGTYIKLIYDYNSNKWIAFGY